MSLSNSYFIYKLALTLFHIEIVVIDIGVHSKMNVNMLLHAIHVVCRPLLL